MVVYVIFVTSLLTTLNVLEGHSIVDSRELCPSAGLPRVRYLNISNFEFGEPAFITVHLDAEADLKVAWFRIILNSQTSFLVEDNNNRNDNEYENNVMKVRLFVGNVSTNDMLEKHVLRINSDVHCAKVMAELVLEHSAKEIYDIPLPGVFNISQKISYFSKSEINPSQMFSATIDVNGLEKRKWSSAPPPRMRADTWKKVINLDSSPTDTEMYDQTLRNNNEGWIDTSTFRMQQNFNISNITEKDAGLYRLTFHHDLVNKLKYRVVVETELQLETYQGHLQGIHVQTCSGRYVERGGTLPIQRGKDDCIMCQASGYPRPHMMWMKYSSSNENEENIVKPDVVEKQGNSYRLEKLFVRESENMFGRFRCVAGYSYPDLSIKFNVVTFEPVQFLNANPSYVELREHYPIKFVCIAYGDPLPTITFYKGPMFAQLPADATSRLTWNQIHADGYALGIHVDKDIIRKITEATMILYSPGQEDVTSGGLLDYKCVASNIHSRDFRTMSVHTAISAFE